jgi:hypothetical protein
MNKDQLPHRKLAAFAALAVPVAFAVSATAQSPTPAAPERAAPQRAAPPAAKSPAAATPAPAVDEDGAPAPAKGAAVQGQKPTVKDVAVGTAVYDSAGQKVGEVNGVKSDGGGVVEEIHVKTGGLLGLGGKVLIVPGAKIAKGGKSIQLAMTSADIGKLPVLPDKKG